MLITQTTMQQLTTQGVKIADWSMIEKYIMCPQLFYNRFELGLVRKDGQPAYGLHFGSGIHGALETWYPSKEDQPALNKFVKLFKPYEEPPSASKKTGKELAATYSAIFGCALLLAYFDKYRPNTWTLVENEVPLAEEILDGFFLAGRIDKIFTNTKGEVFFVDHKTSKYYKDFQLNPNFQFMGYKFLTEKFVGHSVGGYLDMLGVAKSASPHDLLRQEPFNYSAYQMSEWQKTAIHWIGKINESRERNEWPKTMRCRPYFRDCEFMPLCTIPEAGSYESIMNSMYVQEFWDPFTVTD